MGRVTSEESSLFRREYDDGRSIADIALQHGRSVETVWRWLQKTGSTRSSGEGVALKMERGEMSLPPVNRVRFFDEDVFSVKLTPERAWLLGLIFADGSVRPTGRIQVACGQDRDLAEKAAAVIGYDGPLDFVRNCWIMEVSSVRAVADLGMFGVTQAKTHTMAFPSIDEDLLPHFIRGAWDGDGTVYWHRTQRRLQTHYVSSSRTFIEPMRNILARTTGRMAKVQKTSRDTSLRIAYGGTSAETVLGWLYDASGQWMRSDRKFETFMAHRRV